MYFSMCLILDAFFSTLQLKMFEEMGFKVDHSSPIYKRFRLKLLGLILMGFAITISVCFLLLVYDRCWKHQDWFVFTFYYYLFVHIYFGA